MSSTDFLQLGAHKFFEQLRSSLPKRCTTSKSLVAVRDDTLYAWDARDNCVLALNIRTVRLHSGEEIPHQTLLPNSPPLFAPDRLVVNDSNSLLAACGPNGVLVFELPPLTAPYGTFYNNKDVNYVRTHSLHERVLAFSTKIEVRQVRFHPGSPQDNHACLLTNDNLFRIFCIENAAAVPQGVFKVGRSVTCAVPSSRMSMQEALGEVAVDFDFGPPEAGASRKPLTKTDLAWPVYFLAGDATIHCATIALGEKTQPELMGPYAIRPRPDGRLSSEYCSLAVFPTTPPIMAVANCNGHIAHVLVLDVDEPDDVGKTRRRKVFQLFEIVELELGYTLDNYSSDAFYSCPIHLRKDEAQLGKYFATHETGVHSIDMSGVVASFDAFVDETEDAEEALQAIANAQSSIYYLLCTKTSEDASAANPVVGFAFYYTPHSFLALLANGLLVTRAIDATCNLVDGDAEDILSTSVKLEHRFDLKIENILKQGTPPPILKLSDGDGKTQQDCYKLIKRSTASLREQFTNHERAMVEIEKRVRALKLMKEYQLKELNKMSVARGELQKNAEKLAEKYEEMNDRQIGLAHRCQRLLISIAKHQDVPSNAQKEYHQKLTNYDGKLVKFNEAIQTLRKTMNYQDCQIRNHQARTKKNRELTLEQSESFKTSLQDTTRQISEMMKEVGLYKTQLNLN